MLSDIIACQAKLFRLRWYKHFSSNLTLLDGVHIQRILPKNWGHIFCYFILSRAKDIISAESNLGPLQSHFRLSKLAPNLNQVFHYSNSSCNFIFQNSYLAVSRQLKRMVSVTRSPINSSLTESYSGAPTIRAFKMEDTFIDENAQRVEANQQCYYPEVASNSWLFSRLEMLANLVTSFKHFSLLYKQDWYRPVSRLL